MLQVTLLLLVMAQAGTAAAARLALPTGLQQTALLCLAEAQRLCPCILTAMDHGVARLVDCRTIANGAVSLIHGGDVRLDLRALRRHPPRLKIPDLASTPKP